MATRKNWKENGRCDGVMPENPHSNWDHFSFLGTIFFCEAWVAIVNAAVSMKVTKITDVIFIFFFSC